MWYGQRINGLTLGAGRLATALVPLLVLVGAWQGVGRHLGWWLGINLTANAFLELQWYLFSGIVWLGAAFSFYPNGQMRANVLFNRWSERRRTWVELWGILLCLLPFVALLLWITTPTVLAAWRIGEQSPNPGGLPRYWVKSLPLVGLGLLFLRGIAQGIGLRQFLGRNPRNQR